MTDRAAPPIAETAPEEDTDGGTAPGPRFRVMLVRLPTGGQGELKSVLPGGRPVEPTELPLITRITSDHAAAQETARRLRASGATALVTEEPALPDHSAFCADHPHRLAPLPCTRCGVPICGRCKREAEGEELCRRCFREGHSRTRSTRRRQLFVIFLFAVFVYEVVDWLAADQASVSGAAPVRAVIVQLVAPGARSAPVLRALNDPEGASAGTSLFAIGPWYSRERARYGAADGWMHVDVRGPWPAEVRPPSLEDPSLSSWRLLYNAWRWPRYFRDLARTHGVDPDDYGVRAYVIYGGSDDEAAHSRGSRKGRIAVSYVATDEQNAGYAVLTVAHEMGHALGAFDRYDPDTFQARYPEGYVEPFADPLYPQRYAELMAVDIPLSLRSEREIRHLDEVRVGHRTAAEMGWISDGAADLFYTPPALGPLDRLPDREQMTVEPARDNPQPRLAPVVEPEDDAPEGDPPEGAGPLPVEAPSPEAEAP